MNKFMSAHKEAWRLFARSAIGNKTGKEARSRGVLRTIGQTSLANAGIMAVGMLTAMVTARWFGVTGKGELAAIVFWPTLLAGLLSFGLPTSLIYNRKTNPDKGADYVRAGFLFQLPVCLLAGIVAWLCMPAWLDHYSAEVVRIARWYAVGTLPMLLAANLLSALAQSLDRFEIYNGLRLYVPLSNLLGLLALWACGLLTLQHAAWIYFSTSLTVAAWAIYALRSELAAAEWFRSFKEGAAIKRLFGYGSRVYGVELLGTLYTQSDKLIILSLLTAKELGLYTVVYTLSRAFNAVQMAIANVLFPKVTGMSRDRIVQTVGKAFRLSLLIMAAALVPGMVAGRYLLGLLFGAPFLEADTAFYMLCAECVIGGGSWILAASFNALGRPGLVALRQAAALAVTIGLFFALTPRFGLDGIAMALLLGACVRLLITVAAMRMVFGVRAGEVLFGRKPRAGTPQR